MDCMIRYYDNVCRELEDMGFVHEKKLDFSFLKHRVYICSYVGNDFKSAKKTAENKYNVDIMLRKNIRTCP